MAEEIKDLIAKIQQEGVEAAQAQAAQIKAQAQKEAAKIVAQAKKEAQIITEQANVQAQKTQAATEDALKQAGRDMLIGLKQEIVSMLERLIKRDLRQSLNTEELAKIIAALIKNSPLSLGAQIIVTVNPQDQEKLQQGFLKQLIEETKKSIVLKSSEGVESGFVVSFDAGKSIFDFSGEALSEYITGHLKPELNKILSSG